MFTTFWSARIAVAQRHLLGQDLDPLDRLGRDVLDLAQARDAMAVEQHHRLLAAPALPAAGLRGELGEKVGDAARAISADVALVERHLGRNVADRGAGQLALAGDHDLAGIVLARVGRRRRGTLRPRPRRRALLGRLLRRRLRLCEEGGRRRAEQQREREVLGGVHVNTLPRHARLRALSQVRMNAPCPTSSSGRRQVRRKL